jgi:hypothetical protein
VHINSHKVNNVGLKLPILQSGSGGTAGGNRGADENARTSSIVSLSFMTFLTTDRRPDFYDRLFALDRPGPKTMTENPFAGVKSPAPSPCLSIIFLLFNY